MARILIFTTLLSFAGMYANAAKYDKCPKGKRVISCKNVIGYKTQRICWPKGVRINPKEVHKKCLLKDTSK